MNHRSGTFKLWTALVVIVTVLATSCSEPGEVESGTSKLNGDPNFGKAESTGGLTVSNGVLQGVISTPINSTTFTISLRAILSSKIDISLKTRRELTRSERQKIETELIAARAELERQSAAIEKAKEEANDRFEQAMAAALVSFAIGLVSAVAAGASASGAAFMNEAVVGATTARSLDSLAFSNRFLSSALSAVAGANFVLMTPSPSPTSTTSPATPTLGTVTIGALT
jgi:hypothetical protein